MRGAPCIFCSTPPPPSRRGDEDEDEAKRNHDIYGVPAFIQSQKHSLRLASLPMLLATSIFTLRVSFILECGEKCFHVALSDAMYVRAEPYLQAF
mmetsp:Transcript_21200/g.61678  ORF Transcript_21200/g.61678 Transcript_21200/m.61678 type:complete len:95 (-) Transcript_21200:86-370(-)